jgi:4-hydroxy-tetrahydrodipicolinate synthase
MLKLHELRGVLPALVTPLTRDGAVDEPAIQRLIEHVLAGGVHGLLALGSTGEVASVDQAARRQVIAAVVKAAAGRVSVLCGVAQSRLADAKADVIAAAEHGADAVLVAPPYYYPIDQATVLSFYRAMAATSPLPILIYNIPQNTKVVVDPATVAALAREGTVVGIKDSSRDFEYFESVCAATRGLPDFRIFTGSDTMLLASLAMGGAGTICGGANIAPSWVVRIFDDFERGDLKAARTHQDSLLELVLAVRAGVFPSAIKAALNLQGLCEPWLAPPVAPLGEAPLSVLRQQLDHWGLLAPADAAQLRLP